MGFFKCGSSGECETPKSCAGKILSCCCHVLLGIVVIAAVSIVIGWLVMTCWNWVVPAVFNLPALDFWQAVALLVLARLLVGRLHHRPNGGKCGWKGKSLCCSGKTQDPPSGEAAA